MGTEKPKANATYNGLFPLQNIPLNSISTKIMVELGNYLIHKKSMIEDDDKISDESPQFKPDYDIIRCMFANVFQMSKSDKLHNHIRCKLLAHHAEKNPQNDGTYDLKLKSI